MEENDIVFNKLLECAHVQSHDFFNRTRIYCRLSLLFDPKKNVMCDSPNHKFDDNTRLVELPHTFFFKNEFQTFDQMNSPKVKKKPITAAR